MFSQPTPAPAPAPPLAAPTPIAAPAASPRGSAVRPSSRPSSTSPPPGIASPRNATPEPASALGGSQPSAAPTVALLTPGMILGDANVAKLTGRRRSAAAKDVPMEKVGVTLRRSPKCPLLSYFHFRPSSSLIPCPLGPFLHQEALRQALISLVEDDAFLDLFHQKYTQAAQK